MKWAILARILCCGILFGGAPALATDRAAPPKPQEKARSEAKSDKGSAEKDRDETGKFAFRFFGPGHGNRVASFAGIAGNYTTYYAGASAGGPWKSDDGGHAWKPIFEKKGAAAIGAIAVAPSRPSTVWVGTGEPWAIRDIDIAGNGVYKSRDAGKTWHHMGLTRTGRIARIVVDPKDPKTVFVCAEGRLTGPQQERGVFITHDGGKHWTRSLFVDANTGCSGLSMDAHDHNTLIAGTWQVVMHSWAELSGGPGSGVFITHDGGKNWTRIVGHGLPASPVGKIDVAIAPSNPKRVYALIEAPGQGSVWRSNDGGKNWRVESWDRTLIGRAGYYIRIAVSPADDNKVYIANSSFRVSTDGGKTWPEKHWGGDNHDIWMDPKDANHFAITYDGGFGITTTGGKGWNNVALPIGQMYHVAVDNQIPYDIYSNMQDNSTMRGPSVPIGGTAWDIGSQQGWDYGMGGCESGFTLPDPTNPDIVWSTCYAGEVTRWNAKRHEARSVSPWFHMLDSAPNQTKYRCHWTAPLAIDPFDHNIVYYGCQVLFETANGGQSWKVASPDLTTNNPKYLVSSGGLIGDNLGQFYGEVIFAIAPSTVQKGLIWAGTDDGKVWYTPDRGGHWNDVTKNIGMKPMGTVTSIQPSFFKPGTAYVSVDYHLEDDRHPYIYRTTDFGKSWTLISGGLPQDGELAYVRNVSEDPNCEGLLFAGTGEGLFYSLDDGAHWSSLQEGLPPSPVTWTVVQKHFHDLVVSTWGRGLYVLDDITPLEQMARQATHADMRLFAPRRSYRLIHRQLVPINFALKTAPRHDIKIEISDASGKVIRTIMKKAHKGLNRVDWDMRYDDLKPVVLRTVPPEDPHIWDEARFKGRTIRPVTHWGMTAVVPGALAVPGNYTVRLTVGDKTQAQPFEILRDPNSATDLAGMRATFALQKRISGDVARTADMINTVEWMRAQLQAMERKFAGKRAMAGPVAAMDQKMLTVEDELISHDLTPSDDKYYQSAWKVYYNLLWLDAEIGTGAGDVAGGADFGPTDIQPRLLAMIERNLDKAAADYHALTANDVPAFNESSQGKEDRTAQYRASAPGGSQKGLSEGTPGSGGSGLDEGYAMTRPSTRQFSRRTLLQGAAPAALMLGNAPRLAHAAATTARPPQMQMESFPIEAVRLLPSPYHDAMQADIAYLHRLEADRLLHNFREQAGLKPKGAVYGGWESESIAGHTLGHYLSACAHMYAQSGDAECKRRVEYIVGELTLCQAQSPDGYVGGFWRKKDGKKDSGKAVFEEVRRGEIHATAFALNGSWSPLYTWHKLFAGLLDADRYCRAPGAMAVAQKLGGYIEGVFATLDHDQVQAVLACEYGGLNESFAELYARTGKRRWLILAEKIYDNAVLDPLARRTDDLAYRHSNTNIPKLIGLARLYELSGRAEYGAASDYFWQDVVSRYTYAIGGNGDREYFQAPMTISTHITEETCESCSSYNMLKLTRHLYAREPSAAYFDYFERTHLNHILAQQNPHTGMFTYMMPLMSGTHRHFSTPFDDFWCCVGTGMENHAKHGESIYWRQGDTIFVNLYIPSTLDWAAQGTRLEMTTAYPFADNIQLKFTARGTAQPTTVALRVPSWCETPSVTINGERQDAKRDAGYLHLRRAWKAGDTIALTLPRRLRLEPTPDDPDTLAVMYGPLVMAGDLGSATENWDGAAPVFIGDDVLTRIAPQADGAFRTQGIGHPQDMTLTPFAFQYERNSAVYFQRFTPAGWKVEQAREAAALEAQKALDARSTDIVKLGDEKSEKAHGLHSDKSYAVVYRRHHGRDARAGGYMEFTMKTAPGPLTLQLTYWGEERNRHFRILANGQEIGEQKLTGDHPGTFFTCDYTVPEALTRGASQITVRIEPFAKVTAGPVFGARLLEAKGA